MSDQPSITNVDDGKLVTLVSTASQRVLYMAPGVSETLASALLDAWKRLGPDAVSVILDVDAEVCRLGYGTLEGLKKVCDGARSLSEYWGVRGHCWPGEASAPGSGSELGACVHPANPRSQRRCQHDNPL